MSDQLVCELPDSAASRESVWSLGWNCRVLTDGTTDDVLSSEQFCGLTCPTCGKPCRGYAGHAPPHECNQHHTW